MVSLPAYFILYVASKWFVGDVTQDGTVMMSCCDGTVLLLSEQNDDDNNDEKTRSRFGNWTAPLPIDIQIGHS